MYFSANGIAIVFFMEQVSIREFARRVGTTDTTIRNDRAARRIGEDAFDVHPKNGRPVVLVERALEYWYKYNPRPETEQPDEGTETTTADLEKGLPESENNFPAMDKTEGQKAKEDRDKRAKDFKENKSKNEKAADEYADAELREKVARAKLAELKLQEALGELVPLAEVKKNLFTFGAEIRNALQAIPDRIIDNLLAADTRSEAHTILTVAINKALLSLTDIDNRKFTKEK